MKLNCWKQSLLEILKAVTVILLVFLFLASAVLILLGETQYLNEIYLHTALTLFTNVLILTLGVFLADIFMGRRRQKALNEMEEFDRVMQYAAGNFVLPVVCALASLMGTGMIILGWDAFLAAFIRGRLWPQLLLILLFGFISVLSLIWLSATKVYYSKRSVKVMLPFRRNAVFYWADISEVIYERKKVFFKKGNWEHITFLTKTGRVLLRGDVFQDGWDAFSMEALAQVKARQIPLTIKRRR